MLWGCPVRLRTFGPALSGGPTWSLHMKHFSLKVAPVLFAAFALAACTSTDDEDSGGPVAVTPLKGTIGGKEFVGKVAIASPGSSDSKRQISIYNVDVDCSGEKQKAEQQILTSVEWTAGVSKNLKLDFSGESQTVTFVTAPGENVISVQGRIEIIEAPTDANAQGKLRLRATADDNHVEGEIPVLVCER